MRLARELGITMFSTPFDETAVDLLEDLAVPAYKIASFELVHLPLIRRVAATGRPIILSTGMGTQEEIDEAVATARDAGCTQMALLRCNSAYPALSGAMDLRTIPVMAERFRPFNCRVSLGNKSFRSCSSRALKFSNGVSDLPREFIFM